jgi:hypothetical protein
MLVLLLKIFQYIHIYVLKKQLLIAYYIAN